jgi:hypothetical protein
MEIAFIEDVPELEQRDLAFMCAALNKQMREHFAPAWVEEPWPVKAYKSAKALPVGSFWPISIQTRLDLEGAAGYHAFEAGLAYGRVRWEGEHYTALTASHEALELRVDPRCNRWLPIGGGRYAAIEICDPCEADSYQIPVTLFGETRQVTVSDFVLPAYFVKGERGPYTYLNTIDSTVHDLALSRNGGGYLLLREPGGQVIDYWGRKKLGLMRARAPKGWAKAQDPLSRVVRRRSGALGEEVTDAKMARKISSR